MWQVLISVLLYNSFASACGPNYIIQEYVKPCYANDSEINQCIKNMFNGFVPYLAKGLPDIGLEPLEPIIIPHVDIVAGESEFPVHGSFDNLVITGASNLTITNVTSHLNVGW